MDITDKLNMTMLCDFYELTMGNGYLEAGLKDRITYFDIFFRDVPDHGGYAICAGLERIIAYIQDLHFSEEDIEYLRSKDLFSERFLDYLRDFKFTGDVWAIPEGTPIFPREPIITVRAPAIQAQLVETFLLLIFNHQSLVATKTNRIVRAAEGRVILEFGSRRAQGTDAAISGARAAYIGGCAGTACTISDQLFGVPAGGTMAHAWVQMFDSEYEAFKTYCEVFPTNATLLVDTYNTLKSGVPNAIKAFNEVLRPKGITKCAIRLDSGDIAYLTREARQMLDEAGWESCKISASNSLDEYIIQDILRQGAKVDLFGVGERMITSKSDPVFGGVYKLAAIEKEDGTIVPKIKISENVGKITNPHFKKVYRIFDKATGKALELAGDMRSEGFAALMDLNQRSLRAQMKYANKLGARYTVVLGDNEVDTDRVQLKAMDTGEETEVALSTFVNGFYSVSMQAQLADLEINGEAFDFTSLFQTGETE